MQANNNHKQNKLIFHASGVMSVRIKGRWRHRVRKITVPELLALPYEDRARLYYEEYERSRSLVIGHQPVVMKNKGPRFIT